MKTNNSPASRTRFFPLPANRIWKHLLLGLLLTAAFLMSPRADAEEPSDLRAILKQRCLHCHGAEGVVEGEVDLSGLHQAKRTSPQAKLMKRVVSALEDRIMPPEDEPPLPEELRQRLASGVRKNLERILKTLPFEPTPIRRMNRFQYNNAVVDLLELDRDIFQLNERLMRRRSNYFHPASGKMPNEVKVSSRPLSKDIDNQRPEGFRGVAAFPQDKRAEHGFDNRADHLTLSPLLMESFLKLSQSIAESPDLNAKECRAWARFFASRGGADSTLRPRVAALLRRAFRRPVPAETLDRFTAFAEQEHKAGASLEETMRTVVGAVLGMPEFLYFYETPNPDSDEPLGRQRVDDYELAARLAQFLWSSIPDDRLLELAEAKQLRDPDVLSRQIDRMLDDPRSSRFCENFPAQWLQLERLVTSIPDPKLFPYFYYNGYRTSMHMMSEPLLLFETVYVENRSVVDLVAPDFTWESPMLRANYEGKGIGNKQVQVQSFSRVPLKGMRRGGVITNAAVMTMNSTPTRTQPITRGAWVNAVIFNDPPKPPPADVPPLPEADKEELAKMTIRERLAAHRKRADCAGCHNKIDPLGFALENYGPTGVWRDRYPNGRDVDVAGTLFNQSEFKSLSEFKKLIVSDKRRFVRAFSAHLLGYALGRELGPADWPALDRISVQAAKDDRLRTVLKLVAMSEPFLRKNIGELR